MQSVTGSGGAILLSSAPPGSAGGGIERSRAAARLPQRQLPQIRVAGLPIEGSSSLALPPYRGLGGQRQCRAEQRPGEASGRAAPRRRPAGHPGLPGLVPDAHRAHSGLLCLPVLGRLAASGHSADGPGHRANWSWPCRPATTVTTGDINYVVVAENVSSDGRRNLAVGYSQGHLSHAIEHVLKQVPWAPGPLQVAIQTNGDNKLSVWVNGALFYAPTSCSSASPLRSSPTSRCRPARPPTRWPSTGTRACARTTSR